MSDEKTFANGFSFKRGENAPDFVVGRLSMKIDEAIAFMKEHDKGGWVNVNIKQARSGNYYCELDTYDPKAGKVSSESTDVSKKLAPKKSSAKKSEEVEDDLPF
jgi:hypothetical protein